MRTALGLFAFAIAAMAQTAVTSAPQIAVRSGAIGGMITAFDGNFSLQAVVGHPYSADQVTEHVQTQRPNMVAAVKPALPAVRPANVAAIAAAHPRPNMSHESLGTQTIEGVLAEGMRWTTTFPEGSVGNDRPITTVSESWTSLDLKTLVLSKSSDPRTGEHTMRLTNIVMAEPDPALFQVPAEYSVVDEPAPVVR